MTETAFPNDVQELLPESLRRAQEAIDLPEVQGMVQALSAYGLGVFMPHMHDDETGGFEPLPADLISVEEDLSVTFRPTAEVQDKGTRTYVPVGWVWEGEGVRAAASCVVEGTMHKSGNAGVRAAASCVVEGTMHKSGNAG